MKFFFFFLLGCFLFFSHCFSQETQKEFDAKKNFFAVFLQLEGLGSKEVDFSIQQKINKNFSLEEVLLKENNRLLELQLKYLCFKIFLGYC